MTAVLVGMAACAASLAALVAALLRSAPRPLPYEYECRAPGCGHRTASNRTEVVNLVAEGHRRHHERKR